MFGLDHSVGFLSCRGFSVPQSIGCRYERSVAAMRDAVSLAVRAWSPGAPSFHPKLRFGKQLHDFRRRLMKFSGKPGAFVRGRDFPHFKYPPACIRGQAGNVRFGAIE